MSTQDTNSRASLSKWTLDAFTFAERGKTCSDGSGVSQLQPVVSGTTRHAVPDRSNSLMDSMQFRYSTRPRELLYSKCSSSVKHSGAGGGEQSRDLVETSTLAVQQETIGMLSRYLPEISENFPSREETSNRESTSRSGHIVLDDRITPETLHALLHKGRRAAARFVSQNKIKTRYPDEEKIFSPNEAIDTLRTRVRRLEPPYLDHILQAKVFDRPRRDDDPTPREVVPISAVGSTVVEEAKRRKKQDLLGPAERQPRRRLNLDTPAHRQATMSRSCASKSGDESSQELYSLSFMENESSRVGSATLAVPLTPSTNAGDDGSIINQVVAYAAMQRCSRKEPNNNASLHSHCTTREPATTPSPLFSALDTVLSVSKEYEKVRLTWPGGDASQLSTTRRAIVNRITSLESSLIPRHLWVSIHSPTLPGSRWEQPVEEKKNSWFVSKKSVLFPAAYAAGRAQVYLLADALDRMFQEMPGMLDILADREIAQRLLPETRENELSCPGKEEAVRNENNTDATHESEKVHLQYVEAAKHVMSVVDAGLVEVVRQVASSCVERGALLDALRLVITDVTSSCLWVVGYCKERARQEAQACHDLKVASQKGVEETMTLQEELRKVQEEVVQLRAEKAEFEGKASKYDTLIARLQLKDRNFSRHPVEDHIRLLMELEESYMQSTTKGLEKLYEHQYVGQHEGKVFEAPTLKMNRHKQSEQREAQEELYTESYRLLSAMNDTLQAVDAACQPLYDRLELPKPIATSNVASSKWAEIAHAVGAFEAEKKHRQKVFDAFEQWNAPEKKDTSSLVEAAELATREAFEREHSPRMSLELEMQQDKYQLRHDDAQEDAGGKNTWMRFITRSDLVRMGIKDCSPDEVNALYEQDFDMTAYLNPELNLPGGYELSVTVLRDMVHDVSETLRHITLRMNALSNSSWLKESLKPTMVPPTCPKDACMLCGRRDFVEIKNKNKGEALQRVGNEIQRRYEELVMKCQRAEAALDESRKEIQRCKAREKQLKDEWMVRETELLREKETILEENRLILKRTFSSTASLQVPDNTSPGRPRKISLSSSGTDSIGSKD